MICNTAVFYDVENLISLFNVKGNKTLQLDEIHRRILDLEVVCGISVQKAYADWALQINRNLRSYVLQIGIEPVQIFNTNQNDKIKNAADVSLIIDAVELISNRPDIENYVIASGDGIFAFLAKKLHEYGKRVIGCGFDRNTNITFKNACDIFLPLEKTDAALIAVVKNFNKGTIMSQSAEDQNQHPANTSPTLHFLTPPQTPTAQSSLQPSSLTQEPPTNHEIKIPTKLPKNKFSETLVTNDIPIWRNAKDQSGSLHAIKHIINVLFQDTQDDIDLEISLLKAYIVHYLPNFRIGQYGFKRFGEFMRFFVTASPFCLFVSEGTVLRISRRTVDVSTGVVLMEDMPNLLFTLKDGSTVASIFDINDDTSFVFDLEGKTKLNPDPANAITKNEAGESVRKLIKDSFMTLSRDEKLTAKEIKRLLTTDHAQKTFGVKIPILKELHTRSNLHDQRLVDGKIKYWKDEFKFNGKSYLIFKEWTNRQHRTKFETWLTGLGLDATPQTGTTA